VKFILSLTLSLSASLVCRIADTAKALTPLQEEAIWAVAAIAEDPAFHLSIKLEPGDVELLRELKMYLTCLL
jgi:hypothetical protein